MKIMKMNTKRRLAGVLGVLVALCLVVSLGTPVLAVPEMNHQFYGVVTSDEELLPQKIIAEGVSVEAWINDKLCASTTVDADSRYGWETEFEVLAEEASPGDLIEFYINGVQAELYDVDAGVSLDSYPFETGGYTNLTLEADITAPTAPDANLMTVNQNPPTTLDSVEGDAGAVEGDSTVEVWDGSDPSTASVIDSTTATAGGSFSAIDIGDNLHDAVWITAKDAENNRSDAIEMANDIEGPAFVSVAVTDPDEFYKAGDTISFDVDLGEEGLTVTTDLTVLDSALASDFALTDNEDGTYSGTTSALSSETMVEGADTAVALTATDAAGNPTTDDSLNLTIDKTAPTVESTVPLADAPDVAIVVPVTATFDEDIQAGANFADITISEAGVVSASIDGATLTIAHEDFASLTSYTVTIPAGAVEDLAGNPNAEYTWSFTAVTTTYDLTMAAEPEIGGTATDVTNASPYEEGAEVSIKAEAAAGYQFVDWTAPAGTFLDATQAETTFTMPGVAATVTANFAVTITHELTMAVTGSGTTDPAVGDHSYAEGTVVDISATADTGWSFYGWSGDLTGTISPTTITMDADKMVTATFTQDQYTLTINTIGSGSVDQVPAPPYYQGNNTVVTLTANPAAGWSFSAWGDDLTGSTNPETITMDADKTVTATFTEIPLPPAPVADFSAYPLTGPEPLTVQFTDQSQNMEDSPHWFWGFGDGRVSTEPNPNYQYSQEGSYRVSLIVTTAYGSDTKVELDYIVVTAPLDVTNPVVESTVPLADAPDVAIVAPVTATFDEDVTLVDETGVSIVGSISEDLLTGVSLEGRTLTIGHEDFASGEDITVTIVSGVVEDLAGNPNDEISWGFSAVTITHTLTMEVVGEGTVTPESGVYAEGDMAITATPASGWEFSAWSTTDMTEIADASLASTTLTLDKDKTVTATFTEEVTYTLTMAVEGEGTVTPESGVFPEGDMTITAIIPASGWEFSAWSTTDMDEIADPTLAETTLTLDKDKTVTATFTPVVTYDLTVDSAAGGSVTDPGEDTFTYNTGTVVDLVAVPEDGYAFGWWSGDVVADANAASTTITMDSAKSIVANFVAFSAPENVSVTEIDPGVEGVEVTVKATEELDVTEMPAGIEPQEAYVVEPTGEGSFTLSFTDVDNASDIRVYKVVDDGTWTLLDITVVGTTIEVTMDCADPILVFALPPTTIGTATLLPGWNLLSTPIKLDAGSDSVEQILGESVANIELSYRWDAVSEKWAIPTGYELSPLEAIYLKVKADASATAEFIPSQELSWLPSRQLQPGLNLIGPAPAFDLEAGVFPATPLDEALVSIETAGEFWGYCMVVSPPHNQPGWTYALGMEVKDLLPYKGYWVVMDNADTMYGFSTTPISP